MMRISTFILLVTMVQASASTHAQTISLSKNNAPLVDILLSIRKQTDFDFLYSKPQLADAKKVSIHVSKASITEVLDKCFENQPFTYIISDKTVTVKRKAPTLLENIIRRFSAASITGSVTDTLGNPLPGASVQIINQAISVRTNENGRFQIIAEQEQGILLISYLGFKSQEIKFNRGNYGPFQIVLKELNSQLNEVEVVSTGYQDIPRERMTGSFSKPNKQMFEARVSPGIISRLKGITSGLNFNSSINGPTEGKPDINIRGRSTIYANDQPLIVVDNFPYNGNINDLNPQDVASVTILKDAAAASIWGVKAGNGVIVITTKKGANAQKLKIDATANLTVGERPNLYYDKNFLPAAEYIDLQQFLFRKGKYDADISNNTSYPVIPAAVEIMAAKPSGLISAQDSILKINLLKQNDIRKDLSKYFYTKPVNQQYALSLSAGTANSNYYFSAGYDKGQTNQKTVYNDRITLNFSNTYQVLPKLEFSTQLSYIQTSSHSGNTQSLASATSVGNRYYPYVQFADQNGNALPVNASYNNTYLNQAAQNNFLSWKYMPLEELNARKNLTKTNDVRLLSGLKYNLIKGLDASVKYQYEQFSSNQSDLNGLEILSTRDLINKYAILTAGKVTGYNLPLGAIKTFRHGETLSNNLRGQLSYNKPGKHALNAIAGAEIIEYRSSSDNNILYGYDPETESSVPVDNVTVFNLNPRGIGKIPTGSGTTGGTDRYRSYFANAAYTFDHKYILSASARLDGSNYFGVATNQKTVPLWSTGLKWNLSEEKFYALSWLPVLQLRGTFGYSGNLNKSVTGITTFKYNSNADLTGLPYATVSNIGNPQLRWEKNGIFNIGADFSTKHDWLNGSIEYYFKRGIDLIGDQLLAPSVGFLSPATGTTVLRGNFAHTKGQGFDLQLNSKNLNRSLKWSTSLNFSYASDEVTRYDQLNTNFNGFAGNGGNILPVTGKPVYALYSYKWAGLDPLNGDPQGIANGLVSKNYSLLNNPTKLEDLTYNGPARPVYFGGISNHFTYGQLSLQFSISVQLGYYFRRSTINYNDLLSSAGGGHADYLSRWQNPGDELKTTVPSLIYPANAQRDQFYRFSDATVEKGDHIRLQDVNLSYELLGTQAKAKTSFKTLQVFVYGNNLGILWRANKLHIDPDFAYGGIPYSRTIAFGLKAGL